MSVISEINNDLRYKKFTPEIKKIFKTSHDTTTELLQSCTELRAELIDSHFIHQFTNKNTQFLKNIFIRFFIEKPGIFFELDSFKTLNDQFSKKQEKIFPFKSFFKNILMSALKFNADKPLYDDNVMEYSNESEVVYHFFDNEDEVHYESRYGLFKIEYATDFIISNYVQFTNMLMYCEVKNNEISTIDKLKWYYLYNFFSAFGDFFKLFKYDDFDSEYFQKNLNIKDEFFEVFDQTFDSEIIEKMNIYYDKKTEISRKFSSEFKQFAKLNNKISELNEDGLALSQLLIKRSGDFFQYFSMMHFPFSNKSRPKFVTYHLSEEDIENDKNFFSVFYKQSIYQYNELFKSHLALFSSMRKKSIYELIGKETIKNLNYIKTSNHELNPHANYFNCIENNREAFDLFLIENKKLFYPSFSMVGFTGFNQLRSFKSFLKGNNEYKYDFEPISKKGWKFLLAQNESYLFRAMKNIRVANLAFNYELKDAWLRSYTLLLCLENDSFYHGCYDMICRSVSEHQGVVSKYNPFKKSLPYSYQSNKERFNNIVNIFNRFFNDLTNKNKQKDHILNFQTILPVFIKLINSLIYDPSMHNENIFTLFNDEIKAFKYCDFQISEYKDEKDYIKQYKKYYNQYKKGNHFLTNYDFSFNLNNLNINFIYSKIIPKIKKLTPLLMNEIHFQIEKYKDTHLEYDHPNFLNYYYDILCHYNEREIKVQNAVNQIGDYINIKIKNEILPAEKQSWTDVRKYINKYVKDFGHLLELSDRWHRELQEAKTVRSAFVNYSYPELEDKYKRKNINILQNTITFENFDFTLISNSDLLFEEGRNLHHCVYSYSSQCKKNQYIVFQVDMNNTIHHGKRATLGIRIKNGKYIFDQMFSFSNEEVPPIQHFIANKFLQELNR